MLRGRSMKPTSAFRAKVDIGGAVQGVGFRPFVYRLATALKLGGVVRNSSRGVTLEVEGGRAAIEEFLLRLEREKPDRAVIHSLEFRFLDPAGYLDFQIGESEEEGGKTAVILPDLATCGECLRELRDPENRRSGYPFTNCQHCGPRYSIVESMPYDRPNTAMRHFAMCAACAREYGDPRDRRFHAQPIACPECGPQLALWDEAGRAIAGRAEALAGAVAALRAGRIVALKGIGGFQLLVDARDEAAVRRLRERKQREEKPLAVMAPSLEAVRAIARVGLLEQRLLRSPEAPIVLLERAPGDTTIAPSVAPGNPHLGIMLPYSPLHHLLMDGCGFPLVATSGNRSEEPICIEEREALSRLAGIADGFLVHDRPIVRRVDDSVARVLLGGEQVLRRARGYAPLPMRVRDDLPILLAVGAHLKNAVALSIGRDVFVSQHIGDLDSPSARDSLAGVIGDVLQLYDVQPAAVACDLHPDYHSTRYARQLGRPTIPIQHHHAHVWAAMAENELEGPVLGVAWDGTGYGPDETVWGGEFFRVEGVAAERVAHFRTFRLPGGEAAVREPRRAAVGLLYEWMGERVFEWRELPPWRSFSDSEIRLVRQALQRGVNAPRTSSAGRLFDAVASLLEVRQRTGFEGQAAMELEFAVRPGVGEAYPIEAGPVVDWAPTLAALLEDRESVGVAAARFHNALVEAMVQVARRVGEPRVVLTGGCFQNRYLTERAVRRLREEGFRPYWHQRVPPNDGGIALGQVMAAARLMARPATPREVGG
jgi:hydrogenase maturation protein HypF